MRGMGFLQSYKRLDNLCRDMNGIGVTGYLQEMDEAPEGHFCVPGWAEDYRRLKRYRHLRNRIVHENDAEEEALCVSGDAIWLDDFYRRILERTDPLALCYSCAARDVAPAAPLSEQPEVKQPRGCTPELFMAAVTLAALAGFILLGVHIVTAFF